MEVFTTSMDGRVQGLSVLCVFLLFCVLMVGVGLLQASRKNPDSFPSAPGQGMVSIVLVIIGLFIYYLPASKYRVDDGGITIVYPVKRNVRIEKGDILSVRPLSSDTEISKRVGNDGFFGYSGEFRAPGVGSFKVHARNFNNPVLIITRSGRMLLSPDDVGMLERLNEMVAESR